MGVLSPYKVGMSKENYFKSIMREVVRLQRRPPYELTNSQCGGLPWRTCIESGQPPGGPNPWDQYQNGDIHLPEGYKQ